MAVTQQLARLSPTLLAECRSSVEVLDDVCSFRTLPPTEYLDLNWWPGIFERIAKACAPSTLDVLTHVCHGPTEVNPAYRDHLPTIWEHPVTALEPDAVRQNLTALDAITLPVLRAATAEHATRVFRDGFEVIGNPADLAAERFTVLRRFYLEAAHGGLAIIFWWD